MKDMKESLGDVRKADITHIRTPMLVYGARACEYGSSKYERANYMRPVESTRADFERLRSYLRAGLSHIQQTLDSMEAHQATDPNLTDDIGMRRAAYSEDIDPDTTGKVGPSKLPHLCGAVASLNMAITQATRAGLLPTDPGQPWVKVVVPVLVMSGEIDTKTRYAVYHGSQIVNGRAASWFPTHAQAARYARTLADGGAFVPTKRDPDCVYGVAEEV